MASSTTISTEQQGLALTGTISKIIPALSSIPLLGSIIGIASSVLSVFGASHAAAVANEGKVLNTAIPDFENGAIQTMAQLNAGLITEAQAIATLQVLQANYYTTVASIIKKSGPCTPYPTCQTGAADGGMTPRCCSTASSCNAACCNGCVAIEYTVTGLTAIINAGGGNFTIPGVGANGAVQGHAAVPLSYSRPDIVTVFDRQVENIFGITPSVTGAESNYILFAFIVSIGIFALWGVWHFGKRIV